MQRVEPIHQNLYVHNAKMSIQEHNRTYVELQELALSSCFYINLFPQKHDFWQAI